MHTVSEKQGTTGAGREEVYLGMISIRQHWDRASETRELTNDERGESGHGAGVRTRKQNTKRRAMTGGYDKQERGV